MTELPNDRVDAVVAAIDRLDGDARLDLDEALTLLADRRRRLLLEVVVSHDEALTLPDVAEEVAERETGYQLADISAERIKRVYISLYHDHLPRLVDADVLEYDQERDLVAPGYR